MKQRSASILEYGSTRFPELFEWCSARITQVTSSSKTSALDKQLALCTELHDKLFAEDVTLPACVSGGFPTLLSRAVHHSYANGAVQASACLLSADLIRSGCCAETEIPIAHGELSIYTHLLAQVASVPEDVGASIALMLGHAVTMSDTSNAVDKLSQRVLSDKSPVWPCLQGLCDDATFASQPQKRQCFLGLIDLLRICIVVPAVCPTLAGTAEHLAPIVTSLTKSKDAVLLDPVLELLVALQLAATPNTAMTTTLTAAVTELLAASPTPKVPSPLARFASEVFGLGTHKTEFGVKKLMAAVMLCRMPNADASAKLKLLRVLGDDAPSMGPAMSVVLLCVPETLSCVLHFLGHDQPRLACAVLRACLAAAPSGTPTEFRPYQERAGHRLCLRGAIVMLENLMGSESASETRQDAILACRSLLSYPHTTSHVAVIASQCASLVADLIHAHASREEIKNTVEDEALLSAAFDLLQSLEDDELRCATPFDTFTDIATIIIPAGVISTPVTVSGVRLLRRYASIHPIEAAITLDLQFMAQRLAMPEALLEVDAILIEGFLSIMSAIVSKEPKVVTLEWVDCLSALVGFMTTDHGKQHAGIRREYWRCVLQTVHANPDSKEYVLNDSQTHLSESIELELSAKDSGSKLVEANLCILVDVAASVDIPSEDLIRAMAKLTEGAISLAQEDLKLSLIHFFSACSVAAPNDVLTTSLLALLRSSTGGKVVEGNPALTAMCCAGAKVAMYLTKWAATLVDGTVASEWSLPTLLTITSIILRDNVLARQPFVATELVGLSINLMQRASDPHSPLWRASKALVDALSSAFFVKPGEEIKLAGEQLFRYPLFFPFLEALRKKSTDAKQYPELHGARTSTYALLEHLLHAHGVTEEEFCSSEDFRKFFTQHTLIHLNDPICSTFATLMLRNQRLRRWLIAAHREMYFGALSQLKSDAVDAQKKNVFEGYVKEMS